MFIHMYVYVESEKMEFMLSQYLIVYSVVCRSLLSFCLSVCPCLSLVLSLPTPLFPPSLSLSVHPTSMSYSQVVLELILFNIFPSYNFYPGGLIHFSSIQSYNLEFCGKESKIYSLKPMLFAELHKRF